MSTWFRAKKDAEIREKILQEMRELALTHPVSKPGFYKGRHFSTYPDDIRKLKREGNFEEAERLLLHLVRATETESAVEGYREVAPWYYWELAKIYRKQKNYSAEVKVIERYSGLLTHTPGKRGAQILERLSKAKELKAKSARTNSPEE